MTVIDRPELPAARSTTQPRPPAAAGGTASEAASASAESGTASSGGWHREARPSPTTRARTTEARTTEARTTGTQTTDARATGVRTTATRTTGPTPPVARGPISAWLLDTLSRPPGASDGEHVAPEGEPTVDATRDGDVQLALHVIYELSYRGYAGVDDAWEWEPAVLALRRSLERRFERDLRQAVARSRLTDHAHSVEEVLRRFAGPSLSDVVAREGTREQFTEVCLHRSAYQLKEADAHSWGLPRFTGARKAALVEIQSDEYGNGRIGQAHADLFADVLDALGVEHGHGAHIDRLPAVTLATDNLVTMLGTQRRLRAALLGHLAGFELTSVVPMSRYLAAAVRLGLDPRVERFYEVHVTADEHHGELATSTLVGGDLEGDGLDPAEVHLGVAAMLVLEDRFARHVLRSWSVDESSLRPPPGTAA